MVDETKERGNFRSECKPRINKKQFFKISILIIILILVFCLGYFVHNLLWGNDFMIFRINPVGNLASTIMNAEKNGESIKLKTEDLNGILEVLDRKIQNVNSVKIEGLYSNINNDTIEIFVPVKYKSMGVLLRCSGTITFENENIYFNPAQFRIGKLVIPNKYVFKELRRLKNYGLSFENNKIVFGKNLLPFDVVNIKLSGNYLLAEVKKTEVAQQSKPEQTQMQQPQNTTENSSKSSEKTPSQQDKDRELLTRTKQQLGAVYSAIQSAAGKQIISSMQGVVNKMIQDLNYPFKAESDAVLAKYNNLPAGDKTEIKNAILDNMDMDTLRKVKNTFGF